MDSKRAEDIMQSHGVINATYNGMPVWIESIRGDLSEVTLIGTNERIDVPISALTEAAPMQTM